MPSHTVDDVSGAALVGGELRDWSDPVDEAGQGVPGVIVQALLDDALASGEDLSVLLVGPRAIALLDVLPVATSLAVTAVARSLDDVRRAKTRHPGVVWVAGPLDRALADMSGGGRHGLVVALGGAPQLLSPDSQGWSTSEVVSALTEHVAPGGHLLVDVPNGLGLERLLEIPDPARRSDAEFVRGMPGTDQRGLWLSELDELASSARADRTATYAVWPRLAQPSVAVTAQALSEPRGMALAGWAATRAASALAGTRPALVDRARFVSDVFDGGQAMALAPGWLVVLRPRDDKDVAVESAASPTAGRSDKDVPVLVVAETWLPRPHARALVVEHVGDAPHVEDRVLLEAVSGPLHSSGGFTRAATMPFPGRTVESSVRSALRRGDRDEARRLLTGYRGWLEDPSNWQQPAARPAALPDNVALSDDGVAHRTIDDSWSLPDSALHDPGVVVAVALELLAHRIAASADEHPFGPGLAPAALAQELAVLAGATVDPTVAPSVAHLRAALAQAGLITAADVEDATTGGAATLAGYRELSTAYSAVVDAVDEQRRKVRWLEGTLRARDRQVRLLERSIDVESSTAYRTLRQLGRPVPALRRAARRVVDRMGRPRS